MIRTSNPSFSTTRSLAGILVAASLLLYSCGNTSREETDADSDAIPVRLMSLQQQDTSAAIHASGLFTTDDETILSFKNGGVIDRIYVKEGDAVKAGQLLAKLNLGEINALAAQAQLAFEKAERDYNRARQLYLDSVATLEQMENAKTGMEVARRDWDAVKFNQRYAEIKAPANGYVLMRLANEGQVVGPGTPVLQVNGAAKGDWLLKVGVSDRQWAAIQVGDKATVYADAFANESIAAVVFRKSESVDPNSGTFSIQLKVVGTAGLPAVASGMFAKAEIIPARTSGAWYIPYDALLDGDAGKGYVFVTNDGRTARKVQVQIGRMDKDKIAITGGLEEVKSLIISGSPYLTDGSRITVQNE